MGRKLLILNERDIRHPWAGGAELHIAEMARQFVAAGYAPTLLCTRFPGAAAQEDQDGLRVRRFGNRLTYYLQLPFAVRRELRVPGTVIIEHLNKIPFFTPWYSGAPVILLTHHLFGGTAFQQVAAPIAAAVWAAEKLIPVAYRGRPFIAVSPSTRDDLVARGIPVDSIVMVPNGLNHELYNARGRVADPNPTILVLGRVEFYKRIDLVLQAAQRLLPQLPSLRVVVVGDGGARKSLEQMAADLRIESSVTFAGFVSDAQKVAAIQRAHVVANVSEKEGWGLTVLEANACGLPAVASDVPGLRDAVRDGETGLLVPYGDVDALTTALRRVLTDAPYRDNLGRGAFAWAQRFSWRQSAADVLAVVEAVVDRRTRISDLAQTLTSHRLLADRH